MRRLTGLVISALGAFLIVLALLIRFFVVGQVVKDPLNESDVFTLTASNVNYFSPALLSEESGVTMEDTSTVQGDNAAGSSGTAVWNTFSYLYDETNGKPFEYTTERLAFDRHNAQLVNCCGAAINGDGKLHLSGLGVIWPIGSKKQTYEVYNTTLMRPEPFKYVGTGTVDGELTYKYVNTLTNVKAGSETLPGALVGMSSRSSVTLPEYFTGTTVDWVDPVTGAPVKSQYGEHVYLTDSSGTEVLNLLDASFGSTPASVASAVSTAKKYDNLVGLVEVIIPLAGGLAGVVLLAVGIFLALSTGASRKAEDEQQDELEGGAVTA